MTQPAAAADRWLRRFKPNPSATVRLVCFPHAGGSASFYFPLALAHAARADVVVLQYPGRQDRRREPLVRDVDGYVRHIAPILGAEPELPTVYFGHSMGAILAFETALVTANPPAALVVSGRRAPGTERDERVHERDDEGILAELRLLNGTQSDLLGDEEIVRMTMPAIRSDYRVIETYPARPGRPVACPVTALLGEDDPKCTRAEAERWAEHTTGQFRLRMFPGGHFYLAAHQAPVNRELSDALTTVATTART